MNKPSKPTLLRPVEPVGTRNRHFIFLCNGCGNEYVSTKSLVNSGQSSSCGCWKKARLSRVMIGNDYGVSHGFRRGALKPGAKTNPTYNSWFSMIRRCTYPKNPSFHNYGGRGITVCERWMNFENFFADMGEKPVGTSLDRWPDRYGHYQPTNCRWATFKQQNANLRTNILYEIGDEMLTGAEIHERNRCAIPLHTFLARMRAGWAVDDALKRPLRLDRRHWPLPPTPRSASIPEAIA